MYRRFFPHAALFGANLIYAGNYTIAKQIMPAYIQPFGFILTRVVGAILFFWTIGLFYKQENIHKQDWGRLILCGLFGVSINQLMFFKGLSLTTPIDASIMMIMTPVFVLFISLVSGSEPFSFQKIIGLLLGAAGAFLIVGSSGLTFSNASVVGNIFVLINAISYAIYLILVKKLMKKYHPITIMKWVFVFGFPLVFAMGFRAFSEVTWSSFSLYTWSAFIYVVLFVTCLAYLLNITAIKYVNPSLVGIYVYLQPILATLIAFVFGADKLTITQIIASMLIFLGIYFVNWKTREKLSVR